MDMMTAIASLITDTMTAVWPDAEGLPAAEEIRGLLAVPPDPALGDYAFDGCVRLTDVTFPDSLKKIGFHAFCHCGERAKKTFYYVLPDMFDRFGMDRILTHYQMTTDTARLIDTRRAN